MITDISFNITIKQKTNFVIYKNSKNNDNSDIDSDNDNENDNAKKIGR